MLVILHLRVLAASFPVTECALHSLHGVHFISIYHVEYTLTLLSVCNMEAVYLIYKILNLKCLME